MSRISLFVFPLLVCAGCAVAEDSQLEKVRASVAKNLPGVEKEMVTKSAAPGLYQVRKGALFAYVTADGRFLVQGDMIDIVSGEEITESQRSEARVAVLKQFGPDGVIEFSPPNPKYVITVFTDIDCGYCRKLHNEMQEYNDAGIGVRYLFYPRSGPGTPSFAKAESVWCSADRRVAMTQAKRGEKVMAPSSCANPVLKQFEAGEAMGVAATPTLVLPDGEVIRGYVKAGPLLQRLAQMGATKATRAAR